MSLADIFFNGVGLLGPVCFMTAFLMVSVGKWNGTQARFHVFNLLGALAILISLHHDWNLPVFLLEVVWSLIAVYGLHKALNRA